MFYRILEKKGRYYYILHSCQVGIGDNVFFYFFFYSLVNLNLICEHGKMLKKRKVFLVSSWQNLTLSRFLTLIVTYWVIFFKPYLNNPSDLFFRILFFSMYGFSLNRRKFMHVDEIKYLDDDYFSQQFYKVLNPVRCAGAKKRII